MDQKPNNDFEALVLALKLGITAETDEQLSRIQKEIDYFESVVAPEDIELAKARALAELDIEEAD